MSDEALRARFTSLWTRLGGSDPAAAYEPLVHAWQEPHRRYHTLDHLRDCLARLDEAPAEPHMRDLVEAALWYHDVVYRPGAAGDEARSAEVARAALLDGGVAPATAEEVARLVRLTDHTAPPADPAGALVCDVDLSILGRTPAEFAEYEGRIREEYRHVPDPLFRAGRARILSRLLERSPLFRTEHFRARFEAPARRNLQRSIELLGAPGGDVTQITSGGPGDS